MKLLIINGPNLNLLGKRDKKIYGNLSLENINSFIHGEFPKDKFTFFQSNIEGDIITQIQNADKKFDGIIINPGGYAHTSVAIRDALVDTKLPKVEVHLSNLSNRENFRQNLLTASVCDGYISGFKENSYTAAVYLLRKIISKKEEGSVIKAIVFDLDNTLVDFMKMKRRSIEEAIPAMIDAGLDITPEYANKLIDEIYKEQGIEYQQVFDEFLKRVLHKINYKILSAGIVAYRRAREAALKPYPHVYPTLNKLSKMGIKMGILSDAPVKEAWLRLAYLNFHHIFDEVVTFEETGEKKPSPRPFNAILKKLQVKANEALMVGDWVERDIVGASKVGMKTAFARYGDTFNTEHHNADYDLKDIRELEDIIIKENRL